MRRMVDHGGHVYESTRVVFGATIIYHNGIIIFFIILRVVSAKRSRIYC